MGAIWEDDQKFVPGHLGTKQTRNDDLGAKQTRNDAD